MEKYILKNASSEDISELEKGSAFTLEGMDTDANNLNAIVEFFIEKTPNVKLPLTIFTWEGKLFNDKYGLTDSNAYPDDLNFVSLPLTNWNSPDMGRLAIVKMNVGARWLDDIVDNNEIRQREINGDYEEEDYYDDDEEEDDYEEEDYYDEDDSYDEEDKD